MEFSLVFPLFLALVMGLIEFSFVFNAFLSVGHATRDSALVAAEAGNSSAADCVILRTIEDDIGAPADKTRITQVLVYRADRNGAILNQQTYIRTGVLAQGANSTTCTLADGTVLTEPYKATSTGYPAASRCNIVAGCPIGAPTQTLDTIGVKISYQHQWVTPFAYLLNFVSQKGGTGQGNGPLLVQSNAMRMEPVL